MIVPLVWREGIPHLVLIERAAGRRHGGQISFPGGLPEAQDRDLLDTALRETHEELGLERSRVEVVAPLPPAETVSSNFWIQPYLTRLRTPFTYAPQPAEVAAVLEVPVAALLDPGLPIEEEWELPQGRRRVRYFPWRGHRIWGATARIIESLLAGVRAGAIEL